jgi:hypothetical protein
MHILRQNNDPVAGKQNPTSLDAYLIPATDERCNLFAVLDAEIAIKA